jgi:hypothetical protein
MKQVREYMSLPIFEGQQAFDAPKRRRMPIDRIV